MKGIGQEMLSNMTTEQLEELLERLRKRYDAENKPLYKRHIGGRMLMVMQELRKRR